MSEWTDKLRATPKIIRQLDQRGCLYLIDFMEFLEDNGFTVGGFDPGVIFYSGKERYNLDGRQSFGVWKLIKKAKESNESIHTELSKRPLGTIEDPNGS